MSRWKRRGASAVTLKATVHLSGDAVFTTAIFPRIRHGQAVTAALSRIEILTGMLIVSKEESYTGAPERAADS